MNPFRLRILWLLAAGALISHAPNAALAQDFPTRPIKLIAPLAPGGATDLVARVLAERAARYLGQPMVVENRPGAGGTVGSAAVVQSPPDGHTVLMGTIGTLAISPAMYPKMPYDTDRDLLPVSLVAGGQFALITHPSFPARNFAEFLQYVRNNPDKVNYGSAGNGSTLHLGMDLLASMAGLRLTHVPYKGSGPLVTALAAGEVPVGLPDVPSVMQFVRSGRLKALAVTGSQRDPAFPEIPTIAESGIKDYDVVVWLGVMAPAKTPPDIISRLNAAIVKSLRDDDITAKLREFGMQIYASSPQEFAKFLAAERAKWEPIVKSSGATIN
ncbi:MAG: Bug family tripartite tricarboxylate transporter substrate binding protein [Betaproteobacteria bacterium]